MFKQSFQIKNSNILGKSLFKKLKSQIKTSFAIDNIPKEEIEKVLPVKNKNFKILQLQRSKTLIYLHDTLPVYIDISGEGQIIPTIFSLWAVPNQILTLNVNDGACIPIISGADLMGPGLDYDINDIPDFDKDQPVAISCKKVIGVGYTLKSSKEVKENIKGPFVKPQHLVGDSLFKYAWINSPSKYVKIPEELEHIKTKLKFIKKINEEEQQEEKKE